MEERFQNENNMSKTNYMRYVNESLQFLKIGCHSKEVDDVPFIVNPQNFSRTLNT